MTKLSQEKQSEWLEQWSILQDNELFLFNDWIRPLTLDDFKGKDLLEGVWKVKIMVK